VLLDQLNSTAIFVLGKVNRPGSYMMQGPTTVAQALAMAGGTTPYADDGNILVIRREGAKQVAFPFSYSRLSSGKDLDRNIVLKPRDTIVVP
jgi:polysaccharide export outer membrane protein